MTRRHLEKSVEVPSPKTKAGHRSGAGDANSQQKRNKRHFPKQVACLALAELAGARQPCVREFLRASQHRVGSLITVSVRGTGKAKLPSEHSDAEVTGGQSTLWRFSFQSFSGDWTFDRTHCVLSRVCPALLRAPRFVRGRWTCKGTQPTAVECNNRVFIRGHVR